MNKTLSLAMLCLIACGMFAFGADPQSGPAPKLEVVRIHPGSGSTQAVYHVFGGQPIELDMAVSDRETAHVRADIFQKAGLLLAPLEKDLKVGDIGPRIGESVMWQWTLSVPDVKRETELLVRFREGNPVFVSGSINAGSPWQPAGQIVFKVYPKDFVKDDLAQFAKERRIHIFGDDKWLRGFLNTNRIEFADEGADLPDVSQPQKSKDIYLGSAPSAQLHRWLADHSGARASLVVFCQDSGLLPGCYPATEGGIRFVKVTLPILDTLTSDPRSQKTLMEILNLLKLDAN